MDGIALVFTGIDVVADGLDIAELRRWRRARPPRGLWRRLGAGTGVVLQHDDAPVRVALLPADPSVCGVIELRHGEVRPSQDRELFDEVVEDCPVVEELIVALRNADSAVHAA